MNASPSILSIIDFSESSRHVLRWAGDMAARLNVHLTILHPYRLNQSDRKENMVNVKKKIDVDAARNFEFMSKALFKKQNISFDFRTEVGFVQDRVQDYARRNNILFLVIALDQAAGNKEILEEMVKETGVPVVVIPQVGEA